MLTDPPGKVNAKHRHANGRGFGSFDNTRSRAMQVKNPHKVTNFLGSAAGQKFLKLVGLLGSDHDGERSNASGMANRLLREADLTWGEVMGAPASNGSGGLDKLLNDDLRMKLRIAQEALAAERAAHRQTRLAGTAAGATPALLQKIARLEAELKAFKMAANGPVKAQPHNPNMYDRGEAPKKKRSFATPLQKQLNEAIDLIESAMELNDWEQGFVTSIRDLKWKITPKQWDRLSNMARQANVEITIDLDPRDG